MSAPIFDGPSFARALCALLPSGPIWPRDPDCLQPQVMEVLATPYAANTARAAQLIADAFPATTIELLPEWEETLALPDPCAGVSPTITQRQQQVLARFTDAGGCSKPYLVAYAATLGFAITITEYAPARADILVADGAVYDPFWAFVWTVTTTAVTEVDFSADVSFADEPLATYGGSVLECEMRRLAPAHTIVLFAYTGTAKANALGSFVLGRDVLGATA